MRRKILLRVTSRPSWFKVLRLIEVHIIAVGGAGSLGSPAAVSGNPTIRAARRAMMATPTVYRGCANIVADVTRLAHPAAECNHACCESDRATTAAHSNPKTDSPAISPDAVSTPAFSTRAFCA